MEGERFQPVVYVVDQDPEFLEPIQWLLANSGFHVRAFDDPEEFFQDLEPDRPGCILLETHLGGIDGLSLLDKLYRQGVEVPAIFLSTRADVSLAVRAMKAGAHDFLEKPFDPRTLLGAIEDAVAKDGERLEKRRVKADLLERFNRLTPREEEVAWKIAHGCSSKEAAVHLGLSPRTVEGHRVRVMDKMQARSTAHLVFLLAFAVDELPLPEEGENRKLSN